MAHGLLVCVSGGIATIEAMVVDKIAKFQAIVAASPEDQLAHFTLAKALLEVGQIAKARTHFDRAVALQDDWMMAWILLARCRIELEERDLARAALEKARALAIAQNHSDPLIEIDEMLEEIAS